MYKNKDKNQASQLPHGNFPKLGDLLLDHLRDLVDLWQKQQRQPSYRRRLPLLRAATFLFYERRLSSTMSLKLQNGSNSLLRRLP
jgi:hypothetical protein